MDHSAFLDGPGGNGGGHDDFLGAPGPAAPASSVPTIFQKALSNDVPGGGGFDPLGWIAKAGGAINRKAQEKIGESVEDGARQDAAAGIDLTPLQRAISVAPEALLATGAEAVLPQNRLAAGLMLAGPAVKGIKAATGALKGAAEEAPAAAAALEGAAPAAAAAPKAAAKPGFLAQFVQARGGRGITPGMAQYAIDNPKVLDEAPTIEEATKAYVDAVPNLKGKVQSIAQRLNKTRITPADYDNAIDRAGRLLNGTPIEADGAKALSAQDALEGVQTINKALRDKTYTSAMDSDQMHEILRVKDGLMDYLQNNGAPEIKGAAKNLFEAHVKDAFSDWLPRNKYGTTDALRTMLDAHQLAGAGAALAAGGPPAAAAVTAANAILTSPKVLGSVIKNVAAIPRVIAPAAVGAAALSNRSGEEPAPPAAAAVPKSPTLIANILRANTVNPTKSGRWAKELSGIGLPAAMVSNSGKRSIGDLARILHESGAINEEDEGEALNYLKSIAGKMK